MSKWVKTKIFPKKVAKKQLFWGTQIRINWLWGGLTPIFLKVSLFSACVLKNLEHDLRTELCARRQSSIVSDWRPLENYFESDTEKCKKRLFFGFLQITWDFDIETHIQGTTMWKLTSWRFRKCGGFRAYEFLNGSYRCSKLAHCRNFGSVTKNKRRYEKKTRPQ